MDAPLAGEQLIREFRKEEEPVVRERVALILILGGALVPLFGFLDWLLFPEKLQPLLAIRFAAAALCWILYGINRRWNWGYRSHILGTLGFYVVGLSIVKMIHDTGAYSTPYYAGLNLVLLTFCVVLPVDYRWLATHCLTLYAVYTVSVLLFGRQPRMNLFIGNNLFVLGTLVIILIGCKVNHDHRFRAYLLRRELERVRSKLEKYSKRLESSVAESKEKYRLLVDHASDAIFIVQDGRVQFPNPRAVELFGLAPGELERSHFAELFHEEDREKVLDLTENRGERDRYPMPSPVRLVRRSGQIVWVDLNIVPIEWQGKPALLHFARDVTERKEMESELLRIQKMEAIGTLAGGIAHDFNNMLQMISGYLEMVLAAKKPSDPDHGALTKIGATIDRASELTRQLLIYSRKVKSRLQPMDLNAEIVQVCTLLERVIPKMIRIDLHLAGDLAKINADPLQLERVLMNLAVNARDAMADGGTLSIRTENIRLDTEFCKRHVEVAPGDYVLLTVSDTGHGMKPETLERIFDPFFSSKAPGKGTGLGLAIVYSIVKNHGGLITCRSTWRQGTTFEIFFPASKERSKAAMASASEGSDFQGQLETVLLVDDEESLLEVSQHMLEASGYRTLAARSGEEALSLFEKEGSGIDVVLLDLNMPGMGGARCLEEILRKDPEARIIVSTGYLDEQQMRGLLQTGAAGFVVKPYKFKAVLQQIRAVLEDRRR